MVEDCGVMGDIPGREQGPELAIADIYLMASNGISSA